ncbi:MAG: prolyl oligopeptidase family serine peptidase, partial [Pirellulaceae bacterium]|nr:prolyl oligopeptidase family serine peptidase [Pirellulaceae bacterium]
MKTFLITLALGGGVWLGTQSRAAEPTVLTSADTGPNNQLLRDQLRPLVHAALDERRRQTEALTASAEIVAYQKRMRAAFFNSIGDPPRKTPLNARIVGRLTTAGMTVEKLVFESRPGFLVTAAVYLPDREPPATGFPAVLVPCGHSDAGKATPAYQRICMLLARNGVAALCYDPIGQGERKQILRRDERGDVLPIGVHSATGEHLVAGVAPILLGENLASYRIWDGVRAIDYLAARPDIDESRIGCTGNSGGGLMTAYLMAIDERIVAAAPSCFITTTRIKNERPGPGDAEQNLFDQTRLGLDHADYIMMRAPRPTLICSATRDFVPIEGAWDSFRQAKRLYANLGFAERIDLIEVDEKHGFTKPLREAAARWMLRWLAQQDVVVREPDWDPFTLAELQCTVSGQTLLEQDARSIFDLYAERGRRLARQRQADAANSDVIRRIARIAPADQLPLKVERRKKYRWRSFAAEQFVLRLRRQSVDFAVPGTLYKSEKAGTKWQCHTQSELPLG